MSDNKKSRPERNFEKRDAFYRKLEAINFNFDAKSLDFITFRQEFSVQLDALRNVCETTIPSCKGIATIIHLKLISKAARRLKENINLQVRYDTIPRMGYGIIALRDTLAKTCKARFPYMFNPSTLDYDLTRNKLKEMSSQLDECLNIFAALVNELYVDWVLQNLRDNKNIKKLERKGKLKLEHYVFIVWRYRDGLLMRTVNRKKEVIDRKCLRQLSQNLKKFNRLKNFDEKIEKLNGLEQVINDEHGIKLDYCANCKKKFDYSIFDTWPEMNWGCKCKLCTDCLKKTAKNEAKYYRCPVCRRSLDKDWVLNRIKYEE